MWQLVHLVPHAACSPASNLTPTAVTSHQPSETCAILAPQTRFNSSNTTNGTVKRFDPSTGGAATTKSAPQKRGSFFFRCVLLIHPRLCVKFPDPLDRVSTTTSDELVPTGAQTHGAPHAADLRLPHHRRFLRQHAAALWRRKCAEFLRSRVCYKLDWLNVAFNKTYYFFQTLKFF